LQIRGIDVHVEGEGDESIGGPMATSIETIRDGYPACEFAFD
jgi:hypothetical protein